MALLYYDSSKLYLLLMPSQVKIFSWTSNPQEDTRQCRICFQTQEEQDNPLINPACACKGNLTYIHEDCLIQEIQSKYYGFLYHYNCSICKKLIQIKICEVKKPLMAYILQVLLYVLALILISGGAYWLIKNNRRYSKRLIGYPYIKVYDYAVFASLTVVFVWTWYVIYYIFTGRKTDQRRIQFREK